MPFPFYFIILFLFLSPYNVVTFAPVKADSALLYFFLIQRPVEQRAIWLPVLEH